MKKIIIISVFICFALFSNAQRVGVKGGVTLANQKIDDKSTGMLLGYQIGGMVIMPIKFVEFEANLLLTKKGAKQEYELQNSKAKTTTSLLYVDIPLKVNFVLNMSKASLFLGVGPTVSYGVSGKIKYEFTSTSKLAKLQGTWGDELKVNWGEGNDDHFKPFYVALGMQTGVMIKDKIRLALSYDMGLSDISKEVKILGLEINKGELKNNVLAVSFAYLF